MYSYGETYLWLKKYKPQKQVICKPYNHGTELYDLITLSRTIMEMAQIVYHHESYYKELIAPQKEREALGLIGQLEAEGSKRGIYQTLTAGERNLLKDCFMSLHPRLLHHKRWMEIKWNELPTDRSFRITNDPIRGGNDVDAKVLGEQLYRADDTFHKYETSGPKEGYLWWRDQRPSTVTPFEPSESYKRYVD